MSTNPPSGHLHAPNASPLVREMADTYYVWRDKQIAQDRDDLPEALWHYTNLGGLKGILGSKTLWATHVHHLNDTSEFSYGIAIALRHLEEAVKGVKSDTALRILTGLTADGGTALKGYFGKRPDLYVTCFCAEGDLLSQWRGYTETNTGAGAYALKFEPGDPHVWATAANLDLRLRKVIYDPARQEQLCGDIVHRLVGVLEQDSTDMEVMNEFAYRLEDAVVDFATACKHPGFVEEKEWRLIYRHEPKLSAPELKYRDSGGTLVPYVALKLPEAGGSGHGRPLPVYEILVGPGGNQAGHASDLRLYLDQNGMGDIISTCSDTPYR
jgi:hypothetical protein